MKIRTTAEQKQSPNDNNNYAKETWQPQETMTTINTTWWESTARITTTKLFKIKHSNSNQRIPKTAKQFNNIHNQRKNNNLPSPPNKKREEPETKSSKMSSTWPLSRGKQASFGHLLLAKKNQTSKTNTHTQTPTHAHTHTPAHTHTHTHTHTPTHPHPPTQTHKSGSLWEGWGWRATSPQPRYSKERSIKGANNQRKEQPHLNIHLPKQTWKGKKDNQATKGGREGWVRWRPKAP